MSQNVGNATSANGDRMPPAFVRVGGLLRVARIVRAASGRRRPRAGAGRLSLGRVSLQPALQPGVLCRSRSPGLDVELVGLLALQADPVAVAGRACAQFRGDHRHATGRADRWTLLIHVRSLPSADGRPPKRGRGRPTGHLVGTFYGRSVTGHALLPSRDVLCS
jgi:hypothetical protein